MAQIQTPNGHTMMKATWGWSAEEGGDPGLVNTNGDYH